MSAQCLVKRSGIRGRGLELTRVRAAHYYQGMGGNEAALSTCSLNRKWILSGICCALLALDIAAGAEGDLRAPVPDKVALAEAKKTILQDFEEEYAKTSEKARRRLGRELLEAGQDAELGTAQQYALLTEANRQAMTIGDIGLALDSLRAIASQFQVNTHVVTRTVLARISKKRTDAEGRQELFDACLLLAEEAKKEDAFPAARSYLKDAEAWGPKTASVRGTLRQRERVLSECEKAFSAIRPAKENLLKNPDHPQSNLLVGRYYCFVKKEWDQGMKHLAKGSDPKFAEIAAGELASPSDREECIALGDAWWDMADLAKGEERKLFRKRAAVWYRRVMNECKGISRMMVKQRVREAEEAGQ